MSGVTGGPPIVSEETDDYPSMAQMCALWAANSSKDDHGDSLRFTTITIAKTLDVYRANRSQTVGVTLIRQIDNYNDGGFYVIRNKPGVSQVVRHSARIGTIACEQDESFIPIAFSSPRTIIFCTTHKRYAALDRVGLDNLINLGYARSRLRYHRNRQGLCQNDVSEFSQSLRTRDMDTSRCATSIFSGSSGSDSDLSNVSADVRSDDFPSTHHDQCAMTVTDHHGTGTIPVAPGRQWALASQLVEEEGDLNSESSRPLAASAVQNDSVTTLSNNEGLSLRGWEILLDKPYLGTLSEQGNSDLQDMTVESSKLASDSDSYNTHTTS